MKAKILFKLAAIIIIALSLVQACKKDTPLPHNPYDDIIRDDTTVNEIPVDSLTITYVHTRLLLSKCALPGCHVGNFEPDFARRNLHTQPWYMPLS